MMTREEVYTRETLFLKDAPPEMLVLLQAFDITAISLLPSNMPWIAIKIGEPVQAIWREMRPR